MNTIARVHEVRHPPSRLGWAAGMRPASRASVVPLFFAMACGAGEAPENTGEFPTTASVGMETGGAEDSSSGSVDTGSSGAAGCVCAAGQPIGCLGEAREVCDDDCLGTHPEDCAAPTTCLKGECLVAPCEPGSTRCAGTGVGVETCDATGEWGPEVACIETEVCSGGVCLTPCDLAASTRSSQGCSFRANNMQASSPQSPGGSEAPSALVVGNTSPSLTAQLQLYLTQGGAEVPQGDPVALRPGSTHTFTLTEDKLGVVSVLRSGGSYRVESDVPVVAYQHSPIGAQTDNDASMLLPDASAGTEFLISSYTPSFSGDPSYFDVIAIEDGTTVRWTPPVATPAGTGVPAVAAGATGTVMMNAGDTLQVASQDDLTGTRVVSDKPTWVVGAVSCTNVPTGLAACDHLEEQQIPLQYWGEEYVAAHVPERGTELYHWRVIAGGDDVQVSTTPMLPGFPTTLDDGEWLEFTSDQSFVMTGSGPFMPVQYIQGAEGAAGNLGDPAMVQMVPVEQFLDRYAFVTGTDYDVHYVQVTRELGGADVLIDDMLVGGYEPVGDYEVSDWQIAEGSHFAQSAGPFGITLVGYTGFTSYAYPGGLELEVINPG